MKKYLSFILALIMILSGCSQANPSRTSSNSGSVSGNANAQHSEALGSIYVQDKTTLEDIREALNTDDMNENEFIDYAISLRAIGGRGITKNDFIAFFDLIDSMEVPILPDVKLSYIDYSPQRFYGFFAFYYISNTGDEYCFSVALDPEKKDVESIIKSKTHSDPELLFEKNTNKINVYAHSSSDQNVPFFFIDIHGTLVESYYKNNSVSSNNTNTLDISAEDIYKNLTVGTLKNISWIDRTSS